MWDRWDYTWSNQLTLTSGDSEILVADFTKMGFDWEDTVEDAP